jgi:hypothetical protein
VRLDDAIAIEWRYIRDVVGGAVADGCGPVGESWMCPICWQPNGRHWTIPHVWMPRTEQDARRRWFSEEEAEAWLRRRLAEFEH